jgi:acetyl esterase/lipase
MLAIVADYRVQGRHGTSVFEAMADAKSAIRWVRAHAAKLGADPARIVGSGGSAGGHIALSAAVIDGFEEPGEDKSISSKPDALVLFNPVADTSRSKGLGVKALEASPFHHLGQRLAPTLIMHGTADTSVPFESVERFCKEAASRMQSCRVVGYEGATHGFFNLPNAEGKWYRETLAEADRFLTGLGYLKAPGESRP